MTGIWFENITCWLAGGWFTVPMNNDSIAFSQFEHFL